MTSRKKILTFAIIFLLSVLGNALWLFEVVQIKGWHSLSWLSGTLYSPYFILLFVVFAFITPFIIKGGLSVKNTIVWAAILYFVCLICFEAGKQLSYMIYSRFFFLTNGPFQYFILIPLLVFVFFGFTLWFTTHLLINPNRKINMLIISLLCPLAIVLSMVTINVFRGFGSQTDWVDAVKMGYPVFWLTLATGFSGMIMVRQRKN